MKVTAQPGAIQRRSHSIANRLARDRSARRARSSSAGPEVLEDHRPEATAQLRMQYLADTSPQAVAQRQLLQRFVGAPAQRQTPEDDELQMKAQSAPAQRQTPEDEELQRKARGAPAQRQTPEDDELQMKAGSTPVQRQESGAMPKNRTGLPESLKSGIESLSGLAMDDVRVHYNSARPATVQALAYTQGTDIHVAPGQEQHLAHEAWHVAQQKQGRVRPTLQVAGAAVNDNPGLEREADVMGARATQRKADDDLVRAGAPGSLAGRAAQRVTNLAVQQGPSCWLYVLQAVAASKGVSTRYIQMVMKAYPGTPEALAKQKEEQESGREISKRAAALELVADNMIEMIARLHNWKVGEGGRRAGNQIEERIVRRYASATLDSEASVEHLVFDPVTQRADVDSIIDAYVEARGRARSLAAIVIGETDDVGSLLNTGYSIIDQDQDQNDVHLALKYQDLPSYVSIRKRFKVGSGDYNEGSNVIDFTGRDSSEMQNTAHAILLDDYDDTAKVVTYKDPNYGNYEIQVTHTQFQMMAGDARIKLRPFFKEGLSKSKLAEVAG